MVRYDGVGLPVQPRIAVIANDALGNFVVATPLLQALRRELCPSFIHYFGGKRTWQFEQATPLTDGGFPLHGSTVEEALGTVESEYDLVINLESSPLAKEFAGRISEDHTAMVGPVIFGTKDLDFGDGRRGDLWRHQDWTSPRLAQEFEFLSTGFIGEIFVRLAYLQGEVPRYAVPTAPINGDLPDLLLATSASLPEKLWPFEKWADLLERVAGVDKSVGLLGAKPSGGKSGWRGEGLEDALVGSGLALDLRGELTLPQVAKAVGSRPVVTLDNGILHLAAAGDMPVVGLFRRGIHRLWAPPVATVSVVVAPEDGVVSEIDVAEVWDALHGAL